MASRRPRRSMLAPEPTTAAAAELPEAAVAGILQHLSMEERLTSCALVCRTWAAAAAAATAVVSKKLPDSEQCRQLQHWLVQHGGVVVELDATSDDDADEWLVWRPLQLPASKFLQLRSLDLSFLRVQPLPVAPPMFNITRTMQSVPAITDGGSGSGSSSSAMVAAGQAALPQLPQLQELSLSYCRLTTQLVAVLLGSTALTKLQWLHVELYDNSWAQQLPREQVWPAVWQQLALLPNLSELQLRDDGQTAADVAPVSTLQHLQDLSMWVCTAADAAAVAAVVPTSLAALCLRVEQAAPLPQEGQQAALCLTQLTNLQHFDGFRVHIHSSSLGSSLTALQHLRLVQLAYPGSKEQGGRQLLAALAPLTQLRHLELVACQLGWTEPPRDRASTLTCFSALTASTQLTALHLAEWDDNPVPQAAFDHIFPPGRVLPHLEELYLHGAIGQSGRYCVGPAQVARIAASCPALEDITLCHVTPPGFDRSCLLQLPLGVTAVESLDWTRPAA